MAQPIVAEGNGLPKDVMICRFGSAYSTLTVYLYDKKAYDSDQEELNRLDAANDLREPCLEPGERVCFRNHEGNWVRARIRFVYDDGVENDPKVDIVLETTMEIYTRVRVKTLKAVPSSCNLRGHAFPYFIEGLEPYHVNITQKDRTNAVTAQRCADELNKIFNSKSRVAQLDDLICPKSAYLRSARFTRVFVASLTLEGNIDIPSFVKEYLTDYAVTPFFDQRAYFNSARHPYIIPHDGTSVLVPYVSKAGEICEVICLRKNPDGTLRVGLRLLRYLDQEPFFRRLLGGPAKLPGGETIGPLMFVCINSNGSCIQRGVVLKSGKVLGVDTLDVFDPEQGDVGVCLMTHSLGDVLPHLGLFIDWHLHVSGPTPSLGDFVVVTNLRPQREHSELLMYQYDDVRILDEPVVIGGQDLRICTRKAVRCEKPKKKSRKRPRASLVEWYGLRQDLAPFFSEIYDDHPSSPCDVGVLFSMFSVPAPINEL